MTQIRAIETRYAGYRFRSRLEARWAVFFDALGVKWRYEHEGYETSAGYYLPDFEIDLPGLSGVKLFGEVKGAPLRQDEAERIAALVSDDIDSGFCVLPLGDIPDPRAAPSHGSQVWIKGGVGYLRWQAPQVDFIASFDGPIEAKRMRPAFGFSMGTWPGCECCTTGFPFRVALTAARSARFEHGETGR